MALCVTARAEGAVSRPARFSPFSTPRRSGHRRKDALRLIAKIFTRIEDISSALQGGVQVCQ